MASTEPKAETSVPPPTNAPDKASEAPKTGTESKVEVIEAPKAGNEPKTEGPMTDTGIPQTSTPKSTDKASEVSKAGTEPNSTGTPKSAVPLVKTVKVSNISASVTEKDIWEFFTFSGDIHYIEMKTESETAKHAFVTFKDPQGADTAVLLTGATISDLKVTVSHVENYQLPPEAPPLIPENTEPAKGEVAQKAEEVVSTMLAKGFVLGKDALQKAKSFDEKHQFTSNASAKVASIDKRMGLTEKLSVGTAVVSEKMKQVDERYQVTEATKSAIAVAEQKANTAGSALMSNKYVSSGAVWVTGAFAAMAKAAEGVGSKTKEKVEKAEEEKKEALTKEGTTKEGNDNAQSSETKEKVDKAEGENKENKEDFNKEGAAKPVNDNAQSSVEATPVTPSGKSSNDNNNNNPPKN